MMMIPRVLFFSCFSSSVSSSFPTSLALQCSISFPPLNLPVLCTILLLFPAFFLLFLLLHFLFFPPLSPHLIVSQFLLPKPLFPFFLLLFFLLLLFLLSCSYSYASSSFSTSSSFFVSHLLLLL